MLHARGKAAIPYMLRGTPFETVRTPTQPKGPPPGWASPTSTLYTFLTTQQPKGPPPTPIRDTVLTPQQPKGPPPGWMQPKGPPQKAMPQMAKPALSRKASLAPSSKAAYSLAPSSKAAYAKSKAVQRKTFLLETVRKNWKKSMRSTFPWRQAQAKAQAQAAGCITSSSSQSSAVEVRLGSGSAGSGPIRSRLLCKAFRKDKCTRGKLCRFPAPFSVWDHKS